MPTRLALAALLVLVLFALPAVAHAQGPIEVVEQAHEYQFAERLVFSLRARAESEIVSARVIIDYTSPDLPNDSELPDRFEPAKQVQLTAERVLRRGQIAPAQEITYWWVIKDTEGNELETEKETFLYLDQAFDWQTLAEAQITVFYYQQPEAFARDVLETSQAALERLAREAGVTIEFPVKVVVYNSKADMQRAQAFRGETFEEQIVTLGTVVEQDILLLLGSDPGLEITIFHELTHIVLGQATDNPFVEMPAWLNEGLASYNEGDVRSGYDRAVDRACASNTLMPIRWLATAATSPDRVTLFYAQSRSVVRFLLEEHGQEKLLALLQKIKEGNLIDTALEEVYRFDQDGLEDRWREWLGCPPAPGQEAPAEEMATPTPEPQAQAAEPTPTAVRARDVPGNPQADALRRTLTFIVAAAGAGAAVLGALMVFLLIRGDR